MKRATLWYWLLTKRLLRRPAFWAMLLCIPLLAGALALAARQERGVVSIALVCPAETGAARRSADRLLHSDSLVRCTEYADEAAARSAVERGEADAAWIFRDSADGELERFAAGRGTKGAVLVMEREETVFLRLAREQLAAALYPEASRALFRNYLTEFLGADVNASDALIEDYYTTDEADAPIIVFSRLDGSEAEAADYLTAPLRGLLALLLSVTALASAMGFCADERRETFLRLRAPLRRALPLLVHCTALLPVGLASLLALRIAGLLGPLPRELGLLLLYCLALAAGSELLRRLVRGPAALGALIPVLTALELALCPIFFDLSAAEPLRRVLPPCDYLIAAQTGRGAWLLAALALAFAALAVFIPETRSDQGG